MKLPGSQEPLPGRCGAKLRLSDKKYGHNRYCTKSPMRGKKRCERHGGTTPAGLASPHHKGKGLSKLMPTGLGARYDAAVRDPKLLDARKEAARMDALLEEAWDDLLNGVSHDTATQTRKELGKLRKALDAEDLTQVADIVSTLDAINSPDAVKTSEQIEALRNRVVALSREKRQAAESHYKNLALTAQTFSLQEIGVLMAALGAQIRMHVQDRGVQIAIFSGFQGIIDRHKMTAIEGEVVDP